MGKLLVLCAIAVSTAVCDLSGADFTVLNTNSSGPGSLYQAITDANTAPGADRILFNIPGAGVHKISVGTNPLPMIFESLVIDGYSQPGAKPNSVTVGSDAVISIQIDGGAAARRLIGLQFQGGSSRDGRTLLPSAFRVRGLSITGFPFGWISTDDRPSEISFAISGSYGIDSLVVSGNFIGLDPDGETANGNYIGVSVPDYAVVGGVDAASRNVISGNTHGIDGIGIVQGNYIGTNASGTKAVPNGTGIFSAGGYTGSSAIIGGIAAGAGNVISGNIEAIHLGTTTYHLSFFTIIKAVGLRIKGNLIGLQPDGVRPLPNQRAINIQYGSDSVIGGIEPGAGNTIAFNGSGITVAHPYIFYRGGGSDPPSEGNQILSNSIYGNGALGIDVGSDGPTVNDVSDADVGPNTYQNSPLIESTQIANGSVTIAGKLSSTPSTKFTLQYFAQSVDLLRPVQTLLGSNSVTTDSNGDASFSASFPSLNGAAEFNMTATSEAGNTSEFSRNSGRMLNISTRVFVAPGDNAAIGGVIIKDDVHLVVRALGPTLQTANRPFPGRLADPILEVYDSGGKLIESNDDWQDSPSAADVASAGLGPKDGAEAAVARYVGSGSYTVVVRGAGTSSGIALVEAYTVGQTAGEANNISTRGLVGTGDRVMIAGTIVEALGMSTRVVARALGPSLSAQGISDPLADPTLELRDTQGALVASNDNWRDGQADALTAVGLAPRNDKESAIFTRLPSGSYTAIVRGQAGATGVGLVELYNLH